SAARPGSPESTSSTICTENVEKVVKPPRNPTPSASRMSRSNQCSATSRPSTKLPTMLMPTVDHTSASVWSASREMPYRESTPSVPATPTRSVVMQADSPPAGTLPRVGKRRLDTLLAERGLYESRSRAAAAVIAGDVKVAGRPATKPGELVPDEADVAVAEAPPYVSRGGVKLANALDAFELDPAGRRALDAGASTGGFTDVLLQRGADSVIALDVAYGELHWRLRNDERVIVVERRNARQIEPGELPYEPDLIVADLSFISLTKVLPAVATAAAPR